MNFFIAILVAFFMIVSPLKIAGGKQVHYKQRKSIAGAYTIDDNDKIVV